MISCVLRQGSSPRWASASFRLVGALDPRLDHLSEIDAERIRDREEGLDRRVRLSGLQPPPLS